MDELERFRIRMIGEEHNRQRRQGTRHRWAGPIVMLTALMAVLKTWMTR